MKTTSLELSRRLAPKVKIETEYSWYKERYHNSFFIEKSGGCEPCDDYYFLYDKEYGEIPAYTTDELMEWLPWFLQNRWYLAIRKDDDFYTVEYTTYYGETASGLSEGLSHESLPESLGLLAEYLVDNGIYKGKE